MVLAEGRRISLYVNREQWEAPPDSDRQVLEAACAEANVLCMARYDAEHPDALRRLVGAGAQLRGFMSFRDKEYTWFRAAELPFDYFVYSQAGQRL